MRRFLWCSALVAAAAIPTLLAAQTWRTFDVARQQRDTLPLSVHLTYGAGRIRVTPNAARDLYDVHMRYDAERVDPMYRFDAPARQLDVGTRRVSVQHVRSGTDGSEFKMELSRASTLRLNLDIGATEADLDLSGLRIEELLLKTGASETQVRFDTPNPLRMREMRIEFGAASVQVTGAGNANAERVDVSFGVGRIALDFSGEWRNSTDMTITSALGEAVLRVPSEVGIRVESSSFLHSLEAPGLVKRDGAWVSSNWDTATHKLRIRASGALGRMEIARTGRVEVERSAR